ncbi:hypothetical protein ACFSJY_12845 [Thalassotalea euphylliae]|uniref:hypothetical protein n=1 Tax=Thalassotalea euphylliae TaxID=1655234 RepID=UPI0036276079
MALFSWFHNASDVHHTSTKRMKSRQLNQSMWPIAQVREPLLAARKPIKKLTVEPAVSLDNEQDINLAGEN